MLWSRIRHQNPQIKGPVCKACSPLAGGRASSDHADNLPRMKHESNTDLRCSWQNDKGGQNDDECSFGIMLCLASYHAALQHSAVHHSAYFRVQSVFHPWL